MVSREMLHTVAMVTGVIQGPTADAAHCDLIPESAGQASIFQLHCHFMRKNGFLLCKHEITWSIQECHQYALHIKHRKHH